MFKEELIKNGKSNDALPNITAMDLKKSKQTKEKMRSLKVLVSDYMNADKHKWDRFILPKLKKLIGSDEENMNDGKCSPLSINISGMHRESNKISTDELEEANMTLISNDSMQMTSTDSMTASFCERESIPMPVAQIMSHESSSMAGKSVTVSPRSSHQTNAIHKLGASVQMDISIDLK